MDNSKLLLIGDGGHCRSVLDSVIAAGHYKEIGIVGKNSDSKGIHNKHYIGTDEDLARLYHAGWKNAFITVGSVGDTSVREKLYSLLTETGFNLPVIIDPSAIVASDTSILEGTFIGKRAVVNSGTIIDKCAIINTGAIIEHDCTIGKFVHISPAATVCGVVNVGDYSHVGAGSTIRQQITIGERALIGAGSVVVDDIPSGVIAFGNPCKVKKTFE